jgi:small GTP-binding protein
MTRSSEQGDLRHNVVIFGDTGVGKSSLINMIVDNQVALTSADGLACTFESKSYDTTLKNKRIRLWDTAGLTEKQMGMIATGKAIRHLNHLLKGLADGISLLVLCIRAPKIKIEDRQNYKMFYEGLCRQKVPIVLVVTGLEEEDRMENWWDRNEGVFHVQQMSFYGHACITAIKGKRRKDDEHMFAREYEESRRKVLELVEQHCFEEVGNPRLGAVGVVKFVFKYRHHGTNKRGLA